MRLFLFLLITLVWGTKQATAQSEAFKKLSKEFTEAYDKMELPFLFLDYVVNLKNIQSNSAIAKQEKAFNEFEAKLSLINRSDLSKKQQLDYDLMEYEITLNKLRIQEEKQWNANKPNTIDTTGLARLKHGKSLYTYFLKRWVDLEVTPEAMYEFGLEEIQRIKYNMKTIQVASGMDSLTFRKHLEKPEFFYNNPKDILAAFKQKKKEVDKAIKDQFPGLNAIPNVYVKEYKPRPFVEVPGFYRSNENTFYFKYFNRPYSKRQIGWLYIHEGVPGHHYQVKYEDNLSRSDLQKMLGSSCYQEGWAAYVEEIGKDLNAYKDIYDEYGKWEWDLIRSVRVAMDVGINYYGWTEKEALEFWQQYIQELDHIAEREIKRMTRWPAQVITYKYGVNKLLKWRKYFEQKTDFKAIKFHETILKHGSIPFTVLEKHIGLDAKSEQKNTTSIKVD